MGHCICHHASVGHRCATEKTYDVSTASATDDGDQYANGRLIVPYLSGYERFLFARFSIYFAFILEILICNDHIEGDGNLKWQSGRTNACI